VHQRVRVQCHVEPGQDRGVRAVVQIDAAEELLGGARTRLGEVNVADVIVDLVILAGTQAPGKHGHLVIRAAFGHRARQDQRNQRLVDEHRVGLVDEDHVRGRNEELLHVLAQTVPEDVKAQLAHRRVGHLRCIGIFPVPTIGVLADVAGRHAEPLVDGAHPVGVPAGEVVVDRHDVHPVTTKRIPRRGERSG